MPRVSTLMELPVFGSRNRYVGMVSAVLFHPSEPRVIGIEIRKQMLGGLISVRPRYALLSTLKIVKDQGVLLDTEKPRSESDTEKQLGFSWEETIVWRGMPVRSANGERVGTVRDVLYDSDTGSVTRLVVSTGMLGDVAVGRLEVPREAVQGFDGQAVIVLQEYLDIETSGGAAKAAASGYSAIRTRTGQVAEGMGQVGAAVAGAVGRSFKSGLGRKAIDKAKSLMEEDK